MSKSHSFSLAQSHGGASLLDFLSTQGEYRTVQLACVNLVGSCLHFSGSRAAGLVQLADSCGAAAVPPGAAPKISAACIRQCAAFLLCLALLAVSVACSSDTKAAPTKQEITVDPNLLTVDQPERFPTVKVESRDLPTELHANGTIQPDVNKTIHVTSLGSGRVVDLKVRLGDYVKKGQALLVISSPDLAGALCATTRRLRPTKRLPAKLWTARSCSTRPRRPRRKRSGSRRRTREDKAKVDLQTAEQPPAHSGRRPRSSQHPDRTARPSLRNHRRAECRRIRRHQESRQHSQPFTIADLLEVWVVCDVFENDLGEVHMGDSAEIRLNAFPDRVFKGKVADISRVLDPNTRSAKVRIVLAEPRWRLPPRHVRRSHFPLAQTAATRSWFPPPRSCACRTKTGSSAKKDRKRFRRVEVQTLGGIAPTACRKSRTGVKAGDELVANALEFSTAVAEQGK